MKDAPVIWLWRGYFYKPLVAAPGGGPWRRKLSKIDKVRIADATEFNDCIEPVTLKSFNNFEASRAPLKEQEVYHAYRYNKCLT